MFKRKQVKVTGKKVSKSLKVKTNVKAGVGRFPNG